jgi:hypothetical protein
VKGYARWEFPLTAQKKENLDMKELFDYVPGVKPEENRRYSLLT